MKGVFDNSMKDVLIRNVDQTVVERLRRRAESQGRTLKQALKQIIEQAAPRGDDDVLSPLDSLREQVKEARDELDEDVPPFSENGDH